MSTISMPLSSNSAASERSSPRRSHRTHHANVSNPHLQVLGRDGQDLPLFEDHNTIHTTTTSPPPVHIAAVATVAHPLSTSKQWWNSVWNAHKQEQEITTTYASLNGEAATATAAQVQPATTVTTAVTPFTSSLSTTTTTTPTTTLSPSAAVRALLTETTTKHNSVSTNSTSSSSHYTNALQSPQATMQEDLIRQDCSFFYRDMEDVVVSPRTRNALTTTTTLPPRQQSAYRARYQQLNQDYILQHDDLELYTYTSEDEEEDDASPFCAPSSSSSRMCSDVFVTNSSLYYKHNNGRVLMKLPKDKVRLVMDPELGEPGILSAIVSKNNNGNKDDDDDDNSISYILTVHPDLYRKVVLDLAQTSSCLWETQDQVSMRVAVLLLVGILLILFIFTLIYPGD